MFFNSDCEPLGFKSSRNNIFSLSNNSALHHTDICPLSLSTLCHLLTVNPNAQEALLSPLWISNQKLEISHLPPSLLRPRSCMARLKAHLPSKSSRTHLCRIHKPLSAPLIRSLFLTVVAEISARLRRLTSRRARPHLRPEVLALVRRLERLNSLWLEPHRYRSAFHVLPTEDRFELIQSGCEACMLSYIGGDEHVLGDLRAALLGRQRVDRCEPRLLRVVDTWIAWFSEKKASEISRRSESLAEVVRQDRDKFRHTRHCMWNSGDSQQGSDVISHVGDRVPLLGRQRRGKKDENDSPDFESEIIDYYRNLISNTHLPGLHTSLTDTKGGNSACSRRRMSRPEQYQKLVEPSFDQGGHESLSSQDGGGLTPRSSEDSLASTIGLFGPGNQTQSALYRESLYSRGTYE